MGIPGTFGGAVVMNAGAQGGCLAERLIDATVVDPNGGEAFVLSNQEMDYSYRHSRLQTEKLVVLSARFQLTPGQNPSLLSAQTSANLQSRTSSQPYHLPSCGSVFRNPEPQKAGRLIEALNLKGYRIGAAEVSEIHANFIVNNDLIKDYSFYSNENGPVATVFYLKKIKFDKNLNLLNSSNIPYSIVHQYDKRWDEFINAVKNIKNNLGINDN